MKRKHLCAVFLALALVLSVGMLYAGAVGEDGCPIAENLKIKTYRGVSVEGRLTATDPEGDALTFEITTPPRKGEVTLKEGGNYVYTPFEGKRGKDYFGYKVTDETGLESAEATVIISICKQKSAISYTDMKENGAECAAIALAEKDIFIGQSICGEYMFSPGAPVTRGEFITMCMKLGDINVLSGVITTGFEDDDLIPSYLKPYVSTALLTGIISGYPNGANTAVFNGNDNISYAEAAVMLNKTLNLTNVSVSGKDEAPVWAAQACANLSACRIADYSDLPEITRADCAKLLLGAMRILDAR